MEKEGFKPEGERKLTREELRHRKLVRDTILEVTQNFIDENQSVILERAKLRLEAKLKLDIE